MFRGNSRWFCGCHDFISCVQNIDIIICSVDGSVGDPDFKIVQNIDIIICSEAIVDGSVGAMTLYLVYKILIL